VKESLSQGAHPPVPPGGSGGPSQADSPALRKAKDEALRKVVYQGAFNKLIDVGWPEEKAKRLAQIKTDDYIDKRGAELKTGEEARAADRRNEKPNSD